MKTFFAISQLILCSLPFAFPMDAPLFNEYATRITTGTYSFEDGKSFEGIHAEQGEIKPSTDRAKVGAHSLKWNWKGKGVLWMDNPEGLKAACEPFPGGRAEKYEPAHIPPGLHGGVKLWIYSEAPVTKGPLMLQVGHDPQSAQENPRYRIPIHLDFTGWRTVWVNFEEDAKVESYEGPKEMNTLAFIAPEGSEGGLHIDWINFVSFMSFKRNSDHQVINQKPEGNRVDSYKTLNYFQALERMEPAPYGQKEREAFERIQERVEFLILGSENERDRLVQEFEKELKKSRKKGLTYFESLHIEQQNGFLNGTPLFAIRDEHTTPDSIPYLYLGARALFPLALDYRLTGNTDSLDKVLLTLDYLHDQGWAEGSGLGTGDHRIRISGYGLAVSLVQDELRERGLLQREAGTLTWYSMLGSVFSYNPDEGINTDLIRGMALPKLLAVLLMEDGEEKTGAMNGLVDYLNFVLQVAPGYSDTIKPDYTLFHHRGAYQSAYGTSTLSTLILIDWILEGTVFELSPESKTMLRNTLLAQIRMANTYDLHPGTAGRIQTRRALPTHLLPGLGFLKGMEAEFKRIYRPEFNVLHLPGLTYMGTLGTIEQLQKRAQTSVPPATPPQGHFTFPYGAFAVHRVGDWMAKIRGWSQYVWDFEAGTKHENDLGRYLGHGALFLLPEEGYLGSAQDLDTGYHWGFLPGATTKALPIENLIFTVEPDEKYVEGKHRNFTDQTFCGGVTLDDIGFFSMILHDTVGPDEEKILFDDSFWATKSVFFVGDTLYCLGTGIRNADDRFRTVTTLFQNTTDFAPEVEKGIFKDATGTRYTVPGEQQVVVFRGEQSSYGKKRVPSSGPNTRAWIDHGPAPSNAGYEYMIQLPGRAPVEQVPFTVLQADDTAHVLRYESEEGGVTALAVFRPDAFSGTETIVKTDTPLLLLTRKHQGDLHLGIVDPDLRLAKWGHNMSVMPMDLVQQPAESHTAALTLSGLWDSTTLPEGMEIRHHSDTTTLSVLLQHGLPREITLTPAH